jgi:hypothetical protein
MLSIVTNVEGFKVENEAARVARSRRKRLGVEGLAHSAIGASRARQ